MTDYRPNAGDRTRSDQQEAKPTTRTPRRRKATAKVTREATYGPVKLADMLVPAIADRYRYCPELGWLRYSGSKWADVADDAVLHELVSVVRKYAHQAIDAGLSRDAVYELASFSSGGVQMHAIKIARSNPAIATPVDLFDARPKNGDPFRFHTSNGTTIEFHQDGRVQPRPTAPDDLNTAVGCEYDPDATAETTRRAWAKYQPKKEIRRFQLEMMVRGISGMGAEQFTAWYGPTAGNGKSTIEMLMSTIAGDYSLKLPVEMLLARSRSAQEQYRNECAKLRSARVVFADEPEEGSRFAVGEIKALTGGAPVTARENFKAPITFVPHIVLTMISNNRPTWGGDAGLERRYIEIEWAYQVPADKRRETFKDEICAEAPGVLNQVIKHWPGTIPVEIPDVIRQQTELAKRAADPIARFLDEAIEPADTGGRVRSTDLYAGYVEWCRQNGERPYSSTRLGTRLAKLGYEKVRSNGVWYEGILVADEYRVSASRY